MPVFLTIVNHWGVNFFKDTLAHIKQQIIVDRKHVTKVVFQKNSVQNDNQKQIIKLLLSQGRNIFKLLFD